MKKIIDAVLIIYKNGLMLCVFLLTFVTILQVIMRYVFNASFVWAEELCRYLMIWGIMIGATIALNSSKHLRVDYFVGLLPKIPHKVILIISHTIVLALSVFLVIEGFSYMLSLSAAMTPGLNIPKAVVALSIPFCCVMWVVCCVNNIFNVLRDRS